MQAALHQHACAAEFHGLPNLLVDRIEIENVSFGSELALQWPIEGAEGAILRAEIRVINVAVDDVRNHTFRMQLAPHGIGFHPDANEIIGAEHIESLLSGQGHVLLILILREVARLVYASPSNERLRPTYLCDPVLSL